MFERGNELEERKILLTFEIQQGNYVHMVRDGRVQIPIWQRSVDFIILFLGDRILMHFLKGDISKNLKQGRTFIACKLRRRYQKWCFLVNLSLQMVRTADR